MVLAVGQLCGQRGVLGETDRDEVGACRCVRRPESGERGNF